MVSGDAFAFAIIIGAIAYINKEREGVEICYATAERPFAVPFATSLFIFHKLVVAEQ